MLCVIALLGCGLIYVIDTGNYPEATFNSDGTVTYSVSGVLPEECAYLVLDGGDAVDELYLYYDENHASETEFPVMDKFYDTLTMLLEKRGFKTVERVDAIRLAAILSNKSSAEGRAIFFMSGVLPDNVKTDDSNSLMESWFAAGGKVYWSGSPIGSLREVDGKIVDSVGMLSDDYYDDAPPSKHPTSLDYSDIALSFSFTFSQIRTGLSVDCPDSKVLGLSDGHHSSYSVVRMLDKGELHVFGNGVEEMTTGETGALADMIVCGVGYDTVVLDKKEFSKSYGPVTCTTDFSLKAGESFYLIVGKPESQYGACIVA